MNSSIKTIPTINFSIIEKTTVMLVFIALTSILTTYKIKNWNAQFADAAQNVSIIENLYQKGEPLNTISPTLSAASKFFYASPKKVCQSNLNSPANKADDHFRTQHTYFIYYLFAPLLKYFTIQQVLSFFTSLFLVGLLALIYIFLRTQRVSVVTSLLFTLLVLIHPVWRHSIIGQVYADRFFMFWGPFCVLWFYLYPEKFFIGIVLALITCSINDRIGLLIGPSIIIIGYFNFKKTKNINSLSSVIIGIFCALISVYLIKFYINSPLFSYHEKAVDRLLDTKSIIELFTSRADFYTVFIIINFICYASYSFFSLKTLILAIIAILPPLFVSVGGAELTGWLTHYPSVYFPLLTLSSAIGLTLFLGKRKQLEKYINIAIILNIFFFFINIYPQKFLDIKNNIISPISLNNTPELQVFNSLFTKESDINRSYDEIIAQIPKGSRVSTIQNLFPALYGNYELQLYPIGISDVDFIILPLQPNAPTQMRFRGDVSYIDEATEDEITKCLYKRLENEKWDITNPIVVENSFVILRKVKNKL